MRFRHSRRSPLTTLTRFLGVILVIWTTLDVLYVRSAIVRESSRAPRKANNEKIFIASIHWTDELILRTHWISAVVDLAKTLGPERVFVSIEESGSLDDTKGALGYLEYELGQAGIRRSILLDSTERVDLVDREPGDVGWTTMPFDKTVPASPSTYATIPKGKAVPRRIPYLAGLRNSVLKPLLQMYQNGERFDKILFLNDVIFSTEDVLELLSTRDGDYAAACALDFKKAPMMYDTFALRDSEGYEPIMDNWPYFRSRESRDAVTHGLPVPVTSCWNGMLLMDPAPFYDEVDPLRFRGISDSLADYHLEGSECCMIHTDNRLSQTKGVWVNTNVRVAYKPPAYEAVNPSTHSDWPSSFRVALGLWQNRLLRWTTSGSSIRTMVSKRMAAWRKKYPDEQESGGACLIDETQILIFNGWAHV